MQKKYFVYILCSQRNGTLYIGVTGDLQRRVYQHKEEETKGFTSKYNVKKLAYFEEFDDIEYALKREKILKNWRRDWKLQLIEKHNPDWDDLYPSLV